MKRVHFTAHGTVQGVGFRYFAREKARSYGVTGWCRNTQDNKVEGEAQAEQDVLEKFLSDVDAGPRGANVSRLDKEDRDVVSDEAAFTVRH